MMMKKPNKIFAGPNRPNVVSENGANVETTKLSKSKALSLCIGMACLFAVFANGTRTASAQVFLEDTQNSGLVMGALSRLSTGIAWGDINNDGLLDLYVTSWGQASTGEGKNALYVNQNGTFTDFGAATGTDLYQNSTAAVFGDMDNDGDLDLFVANFSEGDVILKNLFIENGYESFEDVTSQMDFVNESTGNSQSAVWGDFDNDGFIDLYVSKVNGKNALYHNDDGESFTLMTGVFADIRDSHYATFTDYDDDGDVDLYVVNKEQENTFYKNNNGIFAKEEIGISDTKFGRSASWVDYNNSNTLDLFLSNTGANSLYNQFAGAFTQIAGAAGLNTATEEWDTWAGTWGDFDGDGDLDLFQAGGFDEFGPSSDGSFLGSYSNTLFENSGGNFTDVTLSTGLIKGSIIFSMPFQVGSFASDAAFGDYDNDGDPDLFVTNNMQNLFFKNTNDTENYLKVRVQGRGSSFNNFNGLGTKVRVINRANPADIKMREIGSGSEPLYAVFGLDLTKEYDLQVTFMKNGILTPQVVTIENITVPLDTLIIQQ